ncbi:MAG TPA: hypothetical protein VK284_09845 [Streptosporangiaceae bacterium]|nr:hypothetical protein [Streptosporangiaceae bacterium]
MSHEVQLSPAASNSPTATLPSPAQLGAGTETSAGERPNCSGHSRELHGGTDPHGHATLPAIPLPSPAQPGPAAVSQPG